MTETARQGPVDSAVAAGARGQPVDGLALTRPSLRDDARPQPAHRRLGQLFGLRLRLRPPTCPQPLGQPSASLQVAHTDHRPGGDELFFFFFSRAQSQRCTDRAAPAGQGGQAAISLDSPPCGRPDHRRLGYRLDGVSPHAPISRHRLNGLQLLGRCLSPCLGQKAPRGNPKNRGPPSSPAVAIAVI